MTTRPLSLHTLIRILVALALSPAIGHAADWDIDQLMRDLAQTRSGHARFVERKSIAMLDKPVESSGELLYTAPDHLEKRTFKPKAESMTVDAGTLIIERGRQKHLLQLQDYPELAAFIDSIRGTLAGDRKALERNYRLSLEGTAERWTLQLLPTDEKMQAAVKRIRIAGVRAAVRSIEITQADGDSSLMRIEKLTAQ
ncbi:MAG: outer membrane lipoprotein carrier protein LolA [Gammaproteobacteria bacterium]|nr:outer membrane lipoprotein carrier protein LolA [Rhodocyclaceae bacterium]MBU3910269.1 outer membrane lipoprotein carrier protein LolA [Gammaproteobacteria bacterium]MBU3989464.1 outer membrane lipoprotein carrier protein LolA [Gammaproteobacteria bacterium]MBU4004198.1 outer membrane lipoprotein carrier protein LolA [Gammaproteobacteria bacterium]MBU4022731.1 outer membrane lipoprotein carrier protein LolA [Gammaproteobacteria bacterium]